MLEECLPTRRVGSRGGIPIERRLLGEKRLRDEIGSIRLWSIPDRTEGFEI